MPAALSVSRIRSILSSTLLAICAFVYGASPACLDAGGHRCAQTFKQYNPCLRTCSLSYLSAIAHLDDVLEQLRDYGHSTTSITLSMVITNRNVGKPGAGNNAQLGV